MNGHYRAETEELQNAPKMVVLDDVACAVAAADELTITERIGCHFDEIVAVAIYCSRDLSDPHVIDQRC